MDSTRPDKRAVRTAGAILGLGLALVLIVVSRPGAAGSPLPATVRISVAPAGELEVNPTAPSAALVADSLLPGGRPAAGGFRIRNQTGSRLRISFRAKPDSTALDGLVRIRIRVGGRLLADTTLQGVELHPASLVLASGTGAKLVLEAWMSKDVLSGYEGRLVHVSLVPEVHSVGGRG
jgi:hypothetical protein